MKSDRFVVGNIELAFDQFGRDDDPAVLLLMGNSAPGLVWPDAFCEMLAAAHLRIIRYDQRDTGLSTYLNFQTHPYTLHDLRDDAFGLLDHLEIEGAHFVGLSQGGILAYLAALEQPSRVASVTTIMSSPDLGPKNDAFTGKPEKPGQLPRPNSDYVRAVIELNSTPAHSDEAFALRFMQNFQLAAGDSAPFDEDFWLDMGQAVAMRRHAQRADVANNSNHSKAQMATPSLAAQDLARLSRPCLVIHGGMDPIFPVAHAEWAVQNLPHAERYIIPDMGHAFDPAFFQQVSSRLHDFLARCECTHAAG